MLFPRRVLAVLLLALGAPVSAESDAREIRDTLGHALGYDQRADGSWWGQCPGCGAPDAQLWSGGLTCGGACRPLDLNEAMQRFGRAGRGSKRSLPPPMGAAQLMAVPEPEEEELIRALLLADANFLLAAYPKSFKTMILLEMIVALATATPFLGRYEVPKPRRAGLVLMEDQAYRVRRRLERILAGRGLTLGDIEGLIYLWFRPPLRFNDATVRELGDYAADFDLDFLGVDSWAYVARGDSNSADEVTPQLQAYSAARVWRPGLTVGLVHHARKDPGDGKGQRITDMIRNSSAFGAWYDVGMTLARRDEVSPVTVRCELRDHVAPDPFAFTVEDQDPAGAHNHHRAGGWLRLLASEHRPDTLERMSAAEKVAPDVLTFLKENSDATTTQIRKAFPLDNRIIDAAVDLLKRSNKVVVEVGGPGKPTRHRAAGGYHA
ncbi:MAG TPA: AAA family ATPase [Longimicrobiales bacterium]|nr:AAA family ATPase [Longimicrobiales bacterium]